MHGNAWFLVLSHQAEEQGNRFALRTCAEQRAVALMGKRSPAVVIKDLIRKAKPVLGSNDKNEKQ